MAIKTKITIAVPRFAKSTDKEDKQPGISNKKKKFSTDLNTDHINPVDMPFEQIPISAYRHHMYELYSI